MTTPKEQILSKHNQIQQLKTEIQDIAKEHVPDYHWLDYRGRSMYPKKKKLANRFFIDF